MVRKLAHASMKPLSLVLACCMLAIACLLAGCDYQQGITLIPAATREDKDFFAAVLYFDYDDVFVSSVRSSLNQSLSAMGIPYQEYDADNDQSKQFEQVDEAIANGAGMLIVNLVSSGNAEQADLICSAAESFDIPVVFFNRPVEQPGSEGIILGYYDNVYYVGTDAAEAGHLQGQMIGSYLLEHFDETDLNHDGVISYALFKGQAGNVDSIYRTKYSVEDANKLLVEQGYPELAYFDPTSIDNFQLDLTGSWSTQSVQSYMLTNLTHCKEEDGTMIELVIANSDAMAQGAILALQTNGYNLGTSDCVTIPVFGVDASSVGKELIAQGVMTGTVTQDAEGQAACIAKMTSNVAGSADPLEGLDDYDRDEENGLANKILLHYAPYDPNAEDEAPSS